MEIEMIRPLKTNHTVRNDLFSIIISNDHQEMAAYVAVLEGYVPDILDHGNHRNRYMAPSEDHIDAVQVVALAADIQDYHNPYPTSAVHRIEQTLM